MTAAASTDEDWIPEIPEDAIPDVPGDMIPDYIPDIILPDIPEVDLIPDDMDFIPDDMIPDDLLPEIDIPVLEYTIDMGEISEWWDGRVHAFEQNHINMDGIVMDWLQASWEMTRGSM